MHSSATRRTLSKIRSQWFSRARQEALPSLLLALLPLLSDCSGAKVYQQHELAQEILQPRAGHNGKLTNQACLEYSGFDCKKWSIREYDLNDPAVRHQLIDFSFVCKLAGKRYKICASEAGVCRTTYECNWWQNIFGGCDLKVERVPVDPYQVLIDGQLKCFSEKAYDWEEVK